MTIYSLQINTPGPGTRTTGTTGWIERIGSGLTWGYGIGIGYTTDYRFVAGSSAVNKWDYPNIINSEHLPAIDLGVVTVTAKARHSTWDGDTDNGYTYLECYATDGTTLLGSTTTAASDAVGWVEHSHSMLLPVGTRSVRFGTYNTRVVGGENSNYWSDFSIQLEHSEALAPSTNDALITLQQAEIAYQATVQSRSTNITVESAELEARNARVTYGLVEVAEIEARKVRTTQQFVEVAKSLNSRPRGQFTGIIGS